MSLKNFIHLTTAFVVSCSIPLYASESILLGSEKVSQNASLGSAPKYKTEDAKEEREELAACFSELQDKFTDFTKSCFKGYLKKYLSGNIQGSGDEKPTISQDKLKTLLLGYIKERCPDSLKNSNIDTEVSNLLNKIPADTQNVPVTEIVKFASGYVTGIFKKYLAEKQRQGKLRLVPQSRFDKDIDNDQVNLLIPDTCRSSNDIKNCKTEGLNYIHAITLQDCVNYYIKKNSGKNSPHARYLAVNFLDNCFCDFLVYQMFTEDLRLDRDVVYRYLGRTVEEVETITMNQPRFAEFSRDISKFGSLGHDVENFESLDYGTYFLPKTISLRVNTTSFDAVFETCLKNLVGPEGVDSNSAHYQQLKQKVKIKTNQKLESCQKKNGYCIVFPTVVALQNPDDDISVESLIHIFNAGAKDETATSEQIDSLIRRMNSYLQ